MSSGRRIAVAQVDGKWPNLALAKLSAWHRQHGVEVEWFNPLLPAETVLASKVFLDTEDDPYLPATAIRGGSGYDLGLKLPGEIEEMKPDWSLWPSWTKDMGYSTRGCIRRCPFCNVREKDGYIHVVAELGDIWTGRRDLVLLDGNLLAAPVEHFRALCSDARRLGVRLDPSQGLDARLFTEEHARVLMETPTVERLHMAFDNVRDESHVRRAIALWRKVGMNVERNILFFVLIGFDSTPDEDLYRVELLRELGANPFVMPFDRSDTYQRAFTRWANSPRVFRTVSWGGYRKSVRQGRNWQPHDDRQIPLG